MPSKHVTVRNLLSVKVLYRNNYTYVHNYKVAGVKKMQTDIYCTILNMWRGGHRVSLLLKLRDFCAKTVQGMQCSMKKVVYPS